MIDVYLAVPLDSITTGFCALLNSFSQEHNGRNESEGVGLAYVNFNFSFCSKKDALNFLNKVKIINELVGVSISDRKEDYSYEK